MKFKLLFFVSCFSIVFPLHAQIKATKLDAKTLPKEIKYEGKIKSALSWTDKKGDHILITTQTGEYVNKKLEHLEDGRDAELFAYHFLIDKGNPKLTWKVYDLIQDCPFDINMDYLPNTTQVTDLNNDGVTEVWLMYKKACRSDVSPVEMKVIMYAGQQKYAMRGHSKSKVSATEYSGGDYNFDKVFTAGPKQFRDFAQKLWKRNLVEKFSRP